MKTVNKNALSERKPINNTQTPKRESKLTQVRSCNIEFYITLVSIITILTLFLLQVLEIKERKDFVKSGLIQKFENNQLIWTKP